MNFSLRVLLSVSLFSILGCTNAAAQLKTDSSFNLSGNRFVVDPLIGCTGLKLIAVQDGSVLVAGTHGSDSLSVWKFLANGTVDMSFGKGGCYSVYTAVSFPSMSNINMLIQRDKKIVVMAAGQHITVPIDNSASSIVLMRINANGTADLSFNNSGMLIQRPDPSYQFTPISLAIDSSGVTDKLYVSSIAIANGQANCPAGAGKWCISKYNANGLLDMGFNGTGFLLESADYIRNAPTRMSLALPLDMKVSQAGRLLVAGAYDADDSGFFMFRLNASGSMDNSFGTAGRVFRPFSACSITGSHAASAQILNDESALFAASIDYHSNGQYDSSVLHFTKCNSDGTLASSFGNGGLLSTTYSSEGHHQYTIDGKNRILVYWNAGAGSSQYMHFRAYSGSGIPDNSYSPNGYEVVEPIPGDAVTYATLNDAVWTKDNKSLFVLERRFDASNRVHIGVFKFQQKFAATTSVAKVSEHDITIAPQPAIGHIDLRIVGINSATITLINAEGRIVARLDNVNNGSKRMDVSTLSRGMYFLHIQDSEGRKVSRPVILN